MRMKPEEKDISGIIRLYQKLTKLAYVPLKFVIIDGTVIHVPYLSGASRTCTCLSCITRLSAGTACIRIYRNVAHY